MVLALEPTLLLLDEPTAGLTAAERARIGTLLVDLASRFRLCIVLVEHDLEFVRRISSRVIVLHQGKIVLDGAVEEAVTSGRGADHLRGRRPWLTVVPRCCASRASPPGMATRWCCATCRRKSEPARSWRCWGRNGVGKTTLLRTVAGFVQPRAGRLMLANDPLIGGVPPHRIAQHGLCYVAQEQALFADMTVAENLRLGVPTDRLYRDRLPGLEPHFPVLLQRLGQKAGTLSGGEQKMLLISRAMLARPLLMLLDEISEGLQPSVVDRLAGVLAAQRPRAWHGDAVGRAERGVRALHC